MELWTTQRFENDLIVSPFDEQEDRLARKQFTPVDPEVHCNLRVGLEVFVGGPWRVTAAAMPALLESRGRVVNVASGLAFLTPPFSTAYCMSKRGLVGYSDALRAEYGDRVGVTTVYPGYIRAPIHDSAAESGITLEGAVPAESVGDAARTLARAALGSPVRDLATTRRGTVNYALASRAPRRLMDRVIRGQLRRLARRGHFEGSPLARDLATRLLA